MRWRARLCAVLVVAASLVPGAATAHAEEVRTFKVWNWNIAGHTMHGGSTTSGVLEHAVNSIINRDADFVSFNEICRGQYKRVQSLLDSRGWPASNDFSRFAATRDPKPGICNGNEQFGHALFSREDLGSSRQYELPWDGRAGTRRLLCAPLQAKPLMKFCSVHITTVTEVPPGSPEGAPGAKTQQLNYMLGLLDGFHAAGETYIVAGDFNAQPQQRELDRYYAPSVNTVNNRNNTGTHRELDDADPNHCVGHGEWTADVTGDTTPPCGSLLKIDMIMARESRITGSYSGDSLAIPTDCAGLPRCSDHRVVIGTVNLRMA